MQVGKWGILHHWALGKLNSMGGWCTELSDSMGGWCRRKLNSMGGWVKKSAFFPPPPPPPPQVFFSGIALSHFFGIIYNNVNGRGIPCGPKSSYSFIQIRSKVHWCLVHGLKICMWIGYNPLINFIISNLSLTFITLPAFFAFSAINILSMSIYM